MLDTIATPVTDERASAAADTPRAPAVAARPRTARMLGDVTSSRHNNFDIIRLLAAWLVLVSHSFAVTGRAEPLHQFGTTLGNVSVVIFFAVSGLLIHRSWAFDPSPRDFWIKRVLRLLPALAVVSLLTAFVLGPLVTTRSLGAYLTDPQTLIYPIRVTGLLTFGAQLPGVFTHNEIAGAVNGPLWSLPIEVTAYALLALSGMLGVLRRAWLMALVTVLACIGASVMFARFDFLIAQLSVLSAFAVGATAYTLRDRIPLRAWVALVSLALIVVSAPTVARAAVWTVAISYLVFYAAYALPSFGRRLTRMGDASYGIYIYAFPIQQLLWWLTDGTINPWVMTALATPIVWGLAQLSWHVVERPALRHKPNHRIARRN